MNKTLHHLFILIDKTESHLQPLKTMASLSFPSFISLTLLLIIFSSMSSNINFVGARHLMETTLPEIPKPELPELPPLPKVELPTLPKLHLPEIPKPELPKLPELPEIPKPELPKVPELPAFPHLPELPKPTLPAIPSLPKDIPTHSTTNP